MSIFTIIKKVAGPVLAAHNFVLEGKQGSLRIAFSKKRLICFKVLQNLLNKK